ncbi:MAG: DNA internalization-related competence protein ComEC/Rec2 [Gammaproteobacteria bacterium]|nr:MAG: DNA internalization-related competence protein ComEC/Rec2 [Gammaproteobacteria bacterium]
MIKTAISFTLGCVLFLQLSTLPSSQWFWALLPTCILLVFIKTRLLAIVIFGALWTFFHASLIIDDQLSSNMEGKDIALKGTVISVPSYSDQRLQFEFRPDQPDNYSLPKKLRLNWYRPLPDNLKAGEQWLLTVRLKHAHGMMNPGTFDYEGWLFQQRVGATGYVRPNPTNKRLISSPAYSINAIRQSLMVAIESHLADSPYLGLIQGLTADIRYNISQQQWHVLRLSGTSHLLAISGLHIGLAAALGFFCSRWLWARRSNNLLLLPSSSAGAIGGFITALFYAGLAGFSIPSQRALIMVATVMFTLLIRRSVCTSHILAVSLLLIVVLDPVAVLSAGFWLSFSAVAIILFITQNRLPSPRWQWAKVHSLIAFGITPLLLLFFMQTSLIAPIANFIAVPVISLLVVPVLLVASLLLWLIEPVGALLLQLADLILSKLWPFLDYLATLPFSHWSSTHIPILYWLPIIVGTIALLSPTRFPAKWLGILGFMPLFLSSPSKPDQGEFWFTLLDVGQGLAAVVQTQHHVLIFDTGPKFSDNFNTGTAIIQPFLQQRSIQDIDILVVSHGDNDHSGGAIPLGNVIPVTQILSSTPQLLPNAKHCHAGQSWQWDGVTFTMLHPEINDHGSENNLSCVLKISTAIGSVLLSGDIESEAEQLLMNRSGKNLKSTLLVVPHHGSKTSSSRAFINATLAELVLFPVGYRNRYHFPASTVIERYQKYNSTLFTTAEHGAIEFKFNLHAISSPITWRQHAQRIWTHQPLITSSPQYPEN